ncbi:hypothetical protein [Pelagibacterium xiamenense]|uniref:hypothetical protein n=1 Tax=Pelagibacterium xiamenense TaxID=2901140 RepID=UPI001E557CE9|nr:hypothetical protein [Pelagibacterium xiamenense]MCD7058920.1 hypothetical protein [Pelagibacterium xiamenense]
MVITKLLSRRLGHLIVVAAALVLIISGGLLVRLEAAPYFWGSGSVNARFERLRTQEVPLPVSIHGVRVATDVCLVALSGLRATLRPQEPLAQVRRKCLALMEEAIAAMPTDSYTWYAGAFMHFQADAVETGNHWLAMSQRTGPAEQWIAEVRVALAEENFERLDDATRALHLADLGLLAASQRGVASIALRYVNDEAFRERITEVVETLDPAIQQRFVQNVRAAAAAL